MVIYVIFWQNYYFFQNIQVNRLDFNAWKCWQTCHYIELSECKLYMGHIHTLVLTREWIAMLADRTNLKCHVEQHRCEFLLQWRSGKGKSGLDIAWINDTDTCMMKA